MAAERKVTKYDELEGRYLFQPIAVESLASINDSATSFLNDVGRRRLLQMFLARCEQGRIKH